ncbi:MAG TPA: FabA/FabZ family ACP-dehydratase [Flavobacterium sp.]
MVKEEIISRLPFAKPFLFVDEILNVDHDGITGTFCFDESLEFYKGHFIDNPVTPGVILIETMAQIALVSFGIYLVAEVVNKPESLAMTSAEIEFLKPVFPGEKVIVEGEKVYFRFGKLKCTVEMRNELNEVVCAGTISGIIK